MSDPNVHWDGKQWLRWDGEEWVVDPTIAPPRAKHTGAIIGGVAAALVLVLLLAAAGIWALTQRDEPAPVAAGDTGTSITTVPIEATQDSFTDPVGTGRDITPKTTSAPVTVKGGKPGLYGGTMNERSCDREQLISFLVADPQKASAWAGVLGIEASEIPSYVGKLTPMLLRSDTLVINHGYVNGQATAFPSVLQAGTAVLAGRRGLPVVRCFCGNPLTTAPTQIADATYTGATWPGWNPQSITIITQNPTFIDVFVVVNVTTGDTFARPAGTDGTRDGAPTATPTPTPGTTGSGTQDQVQDVSGFLDALAAGDYGSADSYTTSAFRGRFGSAANLAPQNWGALTSYQITGAHSGDTFVAVYVQEYWEGGYRQSTYYVTKGGGTYIDDADFTDSDTTQGDYPSDYPEQYPDDGGIVEDEPSEYPSDYPEQYPDDGGIVEEEPTDEAVG